MTEGSREDKKNQLLYRALADFSDACDVPDLTPSCPFYQLQPDGSPICGEECKDILGDELSSVVRPGALSLGPDLAAVRTPKRPRPRRGPSDDQQPYDARQIYLTERSRDVGSWSMTSLISGLKSQYAWMSEDMHDPADPLRAHEIAAELGRRGVEPNAVIRQGFFRDITSSIFWHLRNTLPKGLDELGWVNLLRNVAPDFDGLSANAETELETVIEVLYPYLKSWVLFAPLEDLQAHRIRPEIQGTPDSGLPDRDFDMVWLVERFTSTYVTRWTRQSLLREWRYIHSQCAGCCPAGYMRERVIDVKQIALQLAEAGARSIEEQASDASSASKRLLRVDQFLPLAIEALEKGDRGEAVSIYRMIAKVKPDDDQVANNLGFCILPDNAHEAIGYFERAIEAGTAGPLMAMSQLNLALAHYLLGDIQGALDEITRARENPGEGFYGLMWDIDASIAGDWRLVHIEGDILNYANALERVIETSCS